MDFKSSIKLLGTVVILLEDNLGNIKKIQSSNLITNAGDLFYAQRANQESPDYDFHVGGLILGTAGSAPNKSSIYSSITTLVPNCFKNLEAGYPKRNDTDVSNTGADIDSISYKFIYPTNEVVNNGINRLAITIQSPVGDSPLLMYAEVPTFNKTNVQVLTIFINHNFKGI